MKRSVISKLMMSMLIVSMLCTSVLFSSQPFMEGAYVSYAKSKPKKIVLNKSKITLKVGKTFKIKVKKITPKGADKKLTFKSVSKKIATVSKKGVVKGVAPGKTTIKVTSKSNKKITKKVKVTVKKDNAANNRTSDNNGSNNNANNGSNNGFSNPSDNGSGNGNGNPSDPNNNPSPTPYYSHEPIFDVDYGKFVGRSDLEYTGLITKSPEGMPVANGRFGGPVWQNNEHSLGMQLNHTDTFMFNDASANSEWDYRSGSLGVLNIDFGTNIFSNSLKNHLDLYEARLGITDDDIDINIISDVDSDTVLIDVEDKRASRGDVNIELSMSRDPNERKGQWTATSSFELDNNNGLLSLNQIFAEPCDTGIKENDFYCATSVTMGIKMDGADPYEDIGLSRVNNRTSKLTISNPPERYTIVIGGASSMDRDEEVADISYTNCEECEGYDATLERNTEWWADFWDNSYVYIPSQPKFEQRWTYYMYLAGISNRGKFPSKYNGGNWIAEGDRRDWGNYYWNWNQDSLYQPFFSANHGDLMDPLFTMRERCLPQYKKAAWQLWGIKSDSAYFVGETAGVLGAETLPESMVSDMQKYMAGTGQQTTEIKQFGEKRNRFLVPWNWKFSSDADQINSSVSYVSHTMVATQETAEYYWQKYEYTKDINWLRDNAYKFIKGAAELYRNYDGFVKEDDGYYHFYRTNLHEHIWGGHDVIDDLSLARGIFAVAVKASEILDIDEDLREEWQECLDNLAPYPVDSDPGALGWAAEHNTSGKTVFAQGLRPVSVLRGMEGSESPQFKMLEKFDVLNMETRDQELDDGDFEVALNTFYMAPMYLNQFINSVEDRNGSSRHLEDTAKLGRRDELEKMFFTQYKAFHDTPNLIHDQGDYYSAEGYGTWANGIQTAMNQSIAPIPGEEEVIRVFPAWPLSWDASYKLLAKGGFIVSSSLVDEDIEFVEIESTLGGECRIRNPWDENIVLYRNNVKSETIQAGENDLIKFSTAKDEHIVIVREGTTPDDYRDSL